MHGARPDLEQVLAQEGDQVRAGQPCGGVGERPLEERGAERDRQLVQFSLGAAAAALGEGVEPDLEDGARHPGGLHVGLVGDADRDQLVLDVVPEASSRILVEPLRQEIVRGVAVRPATVGRLYLDRHVQQGEARERDDAIPEGQPRLEVPDMKGSGFDREPYWNAGMTSLAIEASMNGCFQPPAYSLRYDTMM